ncbi:hypothetical protein B0J11DRAFT_597462 [Dendryphion nanum]|uniref:Uncharacterized protein n=1 Tax=Dendryphion nanum TaxID=256645 RepID=A0A9P9EGF9_9PLEO|nr:hypothetical protein B0J11DRAFT_597462 [Dendryphion nanum]
MSIGLSQAMNTPGSIYQQCPQFDYKNMHSQDHEVYANVLPVFTNEIVQFHNYYRYFPDLSTIHPFQRPFLLFSPPLYIFRNGRPINSAPFQALLSVSPLIRALYAKYPSIVGIRLPKGVDQAAIHNVLVWLINACHYTWPHEIQPTGSFSWNLAVARAARWLGFSPLYYQQLFHHVYGRIFMFQGNDHCFDHMIEIETRAIGNWDPFYRKLCQRLAAMRYQGLLSDQMAAFVYGKKHAKLRAGMNGYDLQHENRRRLIRGS